MEDKKLIMIDLGKNTSNLPTEDYILNVLEERGEHEAIAKFKKDEGLGPKVGTVLGHRYLYYVCNNPVISDYEYDMLEKEAIKKKYKGYSKLLVPGSDIKEHYPLVVQYTALALLSKYENLKNNETNT